MNEFLQFNIGQLIQLAAFICAAAVGFQKLKDSITNQGDRLGGQIQNYGERMGKVEGRLEKVEVVIVALARQDERIAAVDARLMSQGQRIDSQATILNGRLEAINNIVSGHTAQLSGLFRGEHK